jgi:hypothetical protein
MLLVTAVMLVVSGLMYHLRGSAQAPAPVPKFEVAAITLCKAGDAGGGRGLFKIISTAVLFIVLAVCYAVWQSNPDSPQPSQVSPIKD